MPEPGNSRAGAVDYLPVVQKPQVARHCTAISAEYAELVQSALEWGWPFSGFGHFPVLAKRRLLIAYRCAEQSETPVFGFVRSIQVEVVLDVVAATRSFHFLSFLFFVESTTIVTKTNVFDHPQLSSRGEAHPNSLYRSNDGWNKLVVLEHLPQVRGHCVVISE